MHQFQDLLLLKPASSLNNFYYSPVRIAGTGKKTIVMLALTGGARPLCIVLADDDEDDRKMFSDAVADKKIHLDAVEDGVKLMEYLNGLRQIPDIIFLDLNMPGKSGKKCLEEIRSNKKFENVPVVIFSTSSSRKDVDETYSMGANLYLRKPNSFSELCETTKKVMSLNWDEYQPGTNKKKFVFNPK